MFELPYKVCIMSLRDIQLSEVRQLLADNSGFTEANARSFQVLETQEHDVETPFGDIRVAVRGTPKGSRPVILTFHDIGMNYCLPLWKSCLYALILCLRIVYLDFYSELVLLHMGCSGCAKLYV
ncbi:hypothetical protein scyTo_0015092 [Scyliorhinus torazame]|uniref:Uncharacterized protein n=1 Tax=Scyliorhinus torazame TaxID=75743 RepID=A0A401P222_SCYTO|nr:hypothetical protein [Scyliorhinus torazame]